ncbi:hypothetical protein CY35_12G056300 [Sphagnum magellanicum]|nr:hypothetical protein CY35_12G056300 [Sphagnum magellanicum]
MMSLEAFHGKRKEPDDLVADLLRNVSISPATKKARVGDSLVPSNIWPSPLFGPSKETLVHSSTSVEAPISPPEPPIVPSSPAPPAVTVPLVQTVSGAEEKALVLYRPLNPPLYPGGPPTGSSELPIKVHAAGYLAAIKALDLQGGPSSAFSSKRLQRVSSCSSLPQAVTSLDNMEDDNDPQISSGNQMALIPWAPLAFPTSGVNNSSPTMSGMMSTPVDSVDTHLGDEEEMIDIEPMEVMEDVANGEVVPADPASQFGSPIPTFGSPQWGTSESLKPPYSKVMWSH